MCKKRGRQTFKTFGVVKAKGSGSSYNFIDELPSHYRSTTAPLRLHYRLQIIDKDGSIQYSDIKQVTINEKQETKNLVIFPNPASKNVQIVSKEKTIATIVSAEGRAVKTIQLQVGTNIINIQGISTGTYYLKTEKTCQQLMIQ